MGTFRTVCIDGDLPVSPWIRPRTPFPQRSLVWSWRAVEQLGLRFGRLAGSHSRIGQGGSYRYHPGYPCRAAKRSREMVERMPIRAYAEMQGIRSSRLSKYMFSSHSRTSAADRPAAGYIHHVDESVASASIPPTSCSTLNLRRICLNVQITAGKHL